MSTFIVLGNYTEQGIANVKQSPGRLTAARKALKAMGGRFKDFYLTMGGYDFVCVIEAQTIGRRRASPWPWVPRATCGQRQCSRFPRPNTVRS
jgi:hypothetical protein